MREAFAVLFSLFFFVASYPYAKNLQLSGYDAIFQLKHYFSQPYEFGGKNRLVFTKRVWRLTILHFLLLLGLNFLIFLLIQPFWGIIIAVVLELVILHFLLLFCSVLLLPVENCIKKSYIKKAKKILDGFRGIKIAITGSFGKSSTKNFLTQMLKSRFSVCCTPKNFNTPMGLCKTANENLKKDDDILVVEMGARKKGDIAELMNMLKPSFGILTAIGEQHLETFGSLEAVKNTKFELCEHMCTGGCVVFDRASENTNELFKKYRGEKKGCLRKGDFAYIESLKMSASGCKFKLHLGEKVVEIKTKVIGELILSDFVLAAAMAYLLGVDERSIARVALQLKPFPHRLQIIKTPLSTIIDDSYNSNPQGAEQALKALRLFKGKKIVVTPGFVEQGERQYELNYKFGKLIASSCDELVIMNKVNQTALFMGAKAGGMQEKHIHFAKNRQTQAEKLHQLQQKGSVVLFENDLPDNFK